MFVKLKEKYLNNLDIMRCVKIMDECNYSTIQSPMHIYLDRNNNSDVSLYTMNVDSNRDLVMSLGIRSVPTIKSFSNGKEVTTKVGVLQEGQLHDLAKNLING
jgi:hypothetical protein